MPLFSQATEIFVETSCKIKNGTDKVYHTGTMTTALPHSGVFNSRLK